MIARTTLPLIKQVVESYGKMGFITGPRQVGKTTLANIYAQTFEQSLYFNWDNVSHQKKMAADPVFFEKELRASAKPALIVFDEIHKYARWKNYLKGIYDVYKNTHRFLVTASGRLDLFKKGGDSLFGRYFSIPILPLTIGELQGAGLSFQDFLQFLKDPDPGSASASESMALLLEFSGFPEPFFRGKKHFYNQWFEERKMLLIREDIRNAHAIRELSQLEMLAHLIPEKVGAPLSVNSLREDIAVAHETVSDWIRLLDQFYYLFHITPFSGRLSRTLKKEKKVYLYDWVEVSSPGYRFENLVALHLWKAVKTWKAMGEGNIQLHFIRDKEKQEVDFCLTKDGQIVCLIEAKLSDEVVAPSLLNFQEKLNVPFAIQLVQKSGILRKLSRGRFSHWVASADWWLKHLP